MTIPKNLTYEQAYNFALEMFKFDKDKTNMWWMTKCNEFNNLAPYEMVKTGKGQQLMRYIQRCVL
jgi:hypothetical protein